MIRYVGSAIFDSWGAHGSIEEHRMTSVSERKYGEWKSIEVDFEFCFATVAR